MFQKRLKSSRVKKELSQQDMADILGISVRSYQRYEAINGFCIPSVETLVLISDALDVSIDWLLGRDDFLAKHADEY